MKKPKQSFDQWWRLVMKIWRDNGQRTSIPEKELQGYYDSGLSPLLAFEKAFSVRIKGPL